VLDASALVLALIGKTDAANALRQRLPVMRRHAPHLIDAEVGNVLRRHEQGGRISSEEAKSALNAGRALSSSLSARRAAGAAGMDVESQRELLRCALRGSSCPARRPPDHRRRQTQ
jgi:hypothetical protein